MNLDTLRKDGQPHQIELYEKPLTETDINKQSRITIVPPRADISSMLAEDSEKYRDHINIPHYRQPLLVFEGQTPVIDPCNLTFHVTTSYHLQAIKKGVAQTVTPISMEGLICTADNKLMYGVRGGQVASGIAHLSPAGNLTYQENDQNPIFRFFYEELTKELGIDASTLDTPVLLGHQDSPVIVGKGFLIAARTTQTFDQIAQRHAQAYATYITAKNSGLGELDARAQIPKPNIDAWEHVTLFPVENTPEELEKIILDAEQKIEVNGNRLNTVDVGRGALILYREFLQKL